MIKTKQLIRQEFIPKCKQVKCESQFIFFICADWVSSLKWVGRHLGPCGPAVSTVEVWRELRLLPGNAVSPLPTDRRGCRAQWHAVKIFSNTSPSEGIVETFLWKTFLAKIKQTFSMKENYWGKNAFCPTNFCQKQKNPSINLTTWQHWRQKFWQ